MWESISQFYTQLWKFGLGHKWKKTLKLLDLKNTVIFVKGKDTHFTPFFNRQFGSFFGVVPVIPAANVHHMLTGQEAL